LDKRNSGVGSITYEQARGEIVLGYVDETGFSATPDNRYAWTKDEAMFMRLMLFVRLAVNMMGCLLSTGHLITSCLQNPLAVAGFEKYLFDGCSNTGETQLSSSFGVDC
jgi:hypothetical protein